MTPLEMFTFGYWGWGNETPKLVQAVDAVEQARGFGPPVFVDVRISRSVRAVGFREKALEKLLGSDRYIWMNRLGNDAIIEGGKMRIHDPSAAADLLELARDNATKGRRVIFFCSCEVPSGCHRSSVADLVLKEAARRRVDVAIDEWPGGEPRVHEVRLSKESISQRIGSRASLPFARVPNLAEVAGLPWGSAVKVTAPGEYAFLTSGPAIVVREKWALPIYFSGFESAEEALVAGASFRTENGYGPRKA